MIKRILNDWKSSLTGLVIFVTCVALLFYNVITPLQTLIWLSVMIILMFSDDKKIESWVGKIINRKTKE